MDRERALELLRLDGEAGVDQVHRAYRALVFHFHPDRHPSDDPVVREVLSEKVADLRRARDLLLSGAADERRRHTGEEGWFDAATLGAWFSRWLAERRASVRGWDRLVLDGQPYSEAEARARVVREATLFAHERAECVSARVAASATHLFDLWYEDALAELLEVPAAQPAAAPGLWGLVSGRLDATWQRLPASLRHPATLLVMAALTLALFWLLLVQPVLASRFAALHLEAEPDDRPIRVLLDGRPVADGLPWRSAALTPGAHDIELRPLGGPPIRFTIRLAAGQELYYRHRLAAVAPRPDVR